LEFKSFKVDLRVNIKIIYLLPKPFSLTLEDRERGGTSPRNESTRMANEMEIITSWDLISLKSTSVFVWLGIDLDWKCFF